MVVRKRKKRTTSHDMAIICKEKVMSQKSSAQPDEGVRNTKSERAEIVTALEQPHREELERILRR